MQRSHCPTLATAEAAKTAYDEMPKQGHAASLGKNMTTFGVNLEARGLGDSPPLAPSCALHFPHVCVKPGSMEGFYEYRLVAW